MVMMGRKQRHQLVMMKLIQVEQRLVMSMLLVK
jgi:hypothetical protein